MPLRHALLAVLVTVLWGVNFVAVDVGLETMEPLPFLVLRFALFVLPLVWFVPRPQRSFALVAAVGVCSSALQFGSVFTALDIGTPAGLASLVLQTQVVATLAFGFVLLGERPARRSVLGCLVALAGIGVIALGRGGTVPLAGLALLLGGATAWGLGNVLTRRLQVSDQLGLLVWSNAAALPVLLVAALVLEGPGSFERTVEAFDWSSVGALAYVTLASTALAFGIWNWLLSAYPVAQVAPFALLVPLSGIGSAWLFLDELPTASEAAGGVIVLAGLAVAILTRRRAAPVPPPA